MSSDSFPQNLFLILTSCVNVELYCFFTVFLTIRSNILGSKIFKELRHSAKIRFLLINQSLILGDVVFMSIIDYFDFRFKQARQI